MDLEEPPDTSMDIVSHPPDPPVDPGSGQQRVPRGTRTIDPRQLAPLPKAPPSQPARPQSASVPVVPAPKGSNIGPSQGSTTSPISLPPLQIPTHPPGQNPGNTQQT